MTLAGRQQHGRPDIAETVLGNIRKLDAIAVAATGGAIADG
ncbi:hypothetical protein GA0004734_00036670 [Rhizobium sp. 9140]|nr:hypothetical protein GA0004734_00036670 [Rhizobium sp. 9140]